LNLTAHDVTATFQLTYDGRTTPVLQFSIAPGAL